MVEGCDTVDTLKSATAFAKIRVSDQPDQSCSCGHERYGGEDMSFFRKKYESFSSLGCTT